MIVAVPKYDLYHKNEDTEVLHAQVACLYWKMNVEIERISHITGYAPATVKNYIRKYSDLVEKYDEYFNPKTPHGTRRVRTPLPYFEDEYIKVEPPEDCGLYLIGSTHFDPMTGKRYFWIKVGMGRNLAQRLRSYCSENPMVFIADVMIVDPDDVLDFEASYHISLSDLAIAQAQNTREWFLVDEQTYMEICSKGFDFFHK